MAFKLTQAGALSLESPVSMFNDLRTRNVKGLLGNQAEILNDYAQRATQRRDVAINVPTGGGKTLIALCIAEWRRRKFQERVVYLCATKQLVNQVIAQAKSQYGISAIPFTGRVREFDQHAKSAYNGGDVVAVTTYAHLFNTNPFFSDPETIIFDDAHAAESYIASGWSVSLHRRNPETAPAFQAIVGILKGMISEADLHRMQGHADDWSRQWVEMLPVIDIFEQHGALVSALDEYLIDTKQMHPWTLLRDHLLACQIYFGANEILIRPLIVPTSTHKPFEEAKQRIYLSATLGLDGDLERATGRREIFRLKPAQGSERQGLGRRLFFFPGASLDENETDELVCEFIEEAGRAVILTTDTRKAEEKCDLVKQHVGYPTFGAEDIETSKSVFTGRPQAVAVLANRYDGIDFPDDECRLLFVAGRPSAVSLQERFLVSRFGAIKALNDRILTRIVQGFGRCTRSSTDYAAVVVLEGDLEAFLEKRQNREGFHPELQAELAFGLEQSRGSTKADMRENLRLFLKRDAVLDQVESDILSKRDNAQQVVPKYALNLNKCAPHEVEFSERMWHGDFVGALSQARAVLTCLSDPDLRGYRAAWHYLAGSAAWLAQKHQLGASLPLAVEQFRASSNAAAGIRWLNRLSALSSLPRADESDAIDSQAMVLVERIEERIVRLQLIHDRKFDAIEAVIRTGILTDTATDFEGGLLVLGQHLGYECDRPKGKSTPDGWWKVDESLCFVFEANSEGDENVKLGAEKARQAKLHPEWIRKNVPLDEDADVISILITPKTDIEEDAKVFLDGVVYWDISDFRNWTDSALASIREARKSFSAGDLAWRATAAELLSRNAVAPQTLIKKITPFTK